jgi:hypothetical protein
VSFIFDLSLLRRCLVLSALCLPWAFAQGLETRLELRFSSALAVNAALPPVASWGLGAHLEARYALGDAHFNLVLDPAVQFGLPIFTDPGLTEAFVLVRQGELDLSAGLERLPLEYARLSVPFLLEAVSPLGNRQGRLGARVGWSPEATRLRLALLQVGSGLAAVLSLRREFDTLELEGHAAYQDGLVLGLGGSGTVEEIVVYGEAWWLRGRDWRYLLGLSGSLEEGLWTLEGGYAAPSVLEPLRHLLAAQLTLPQGEEASWSFIGKLLFDPQGFRSQLGASYTWSREDRELIAGVLAQTGPEPFSLKLSLEARLYPQFP